MSSALSVVILLCAPRERQGRQNALKVNLTNEAGMSFDIRYFHFWNTNKAGMFMKTKMLSTKSRNVIDK